MREYAELLERVEGLEAALRTANDMVCRHSMPHGWTVFQEKHRLPPAWVVVETPPPSVCTEHHVCRPPIDGPHEPASGSNWTCPSCKTHWVYEGAWVLLSKALRDAPHPWGPGCAHDPECATELEHSLVTEEPAPRTSDPLVRCWRCKHEVPESTTVCNAGIGTQCKDSKSCRGRSYGPHPRTKEAPPECRVWCSVDQPCPECTPQRTSKIDAALVRLEREYGHRTNEASSQVKDGAPNLNSDAGNERQLMQRTDSPVYSLAYIARIAIDGGPSFSIPCRVPEPEAISMFEAIHARETLRASIQFETVAGLPRTEPARSAFAETPKRRIEVEPTHLGYLIHLRDVWGAAAHVNADEARALTDALIAAQGSETALAAMCESCETRPASKWCNGCIVEDHQAAELQKECCDAVSMASDASWNTAIEKAAEVARSLTCHSGDQRQFRDDVRAHILALKVVPTGGEGTC
jgi:hypothetical protein